MGGQRQNLHAAEWCGSLSASMDRWLDGPATAREGSLVARYPALAIGLLVLLAACAVRPPPTFEVVGIPEREADVYPQAQARQGVMVAVDALLGARAWRAFGAPLADHGILPVLVVISNRSDQRMEVTPADVLLVRGEQVMDSLPIELVARQIEDRQRRIDDTLAVEIRDYLGEVSLEPRQLAPRETYRGVLFFALDAPPRQSRYERFDIFRAAFQSPYRLNVRVTLLESGERPAFGPFAIVR